MHPPCGGRWYDGGIRPHRTRPVAVAVAGALVLTVLAGCGDDTPSAGEARADQARAAADAAGLPDDVADVLADAAAAVDATYRVVYELAGADGARSRVTVTQRPPDLRVDVEADDGTLDATIDVDGRSHQCVRPPDGEWACEELGRPPEAAGFDDAAVDELAAALASAVGDYDIAVDERDVADVQTRCIVTRLRADASGDAALGDDGALCVADTGAILLVERPTGTLRALEYGTEVDDAAFDLPA